MLDEPHSDDRIVELIAKSFDEPLTPAEQSQVDAAMQASLAIRIASQGLQEFDALLKRTGMAIPDEGFPLRVLARIDAYERRRDRSQWLLAIAIIFLGLFAALLWFGVNGSAVISAALVLASGLYILLPLSFAFLFALAAFIGNGPILIYAFLVLILTLLWARASGGWNPAETHH